MTVNEYMNLLEANPRNFKQTSGILYDKASNRVCAIGLLLAEQDGNFITNEHTDWLPMWKPKDSEQLYSFDIAFNYLEKPDRIEDKDWQPGFLEFIVQCNDYDNLSFKEIAFKIEQWVDNHYRKIE